MGRKVRKFDGPCGPKGCGIAFGDGYKVNVTRFTFPPPTVILNEVKDLGTRR